MSYQDTPVLVLIFNRPDKVRKLITALEKVKPKHIFVSADGPRSHVATDAAKCVEARELFKNLPWDCIVTTNFSDSNLGCKRGVASGITWFFSQVTEGIILEDDCIPDPSFFPYATDLLQRYRHHAEVMHVNGTSFLPLLDTSISESYYFSHIPHVWGWASWRRAWQRYDIDMQKLSNLANKLITDKVFAKKQHAYYWQQLCRHVQEKNIDTWDAQWIYSILMNDGVCISPRVNIIENVGFDAEATHTTESPDTLMRATELDTKNLVHPPTIHVNQQCDTTEMKLIFIPKSWHRIRALFKKCYHLLTT